MDIWQPTWDDLLRHHGLDDDESTFLDEEGNIGIPVPRRVQPALYSSSGLRLGIIGRPRLRVRPTWEECTDPVTGQVAWVLCFDCAEPVT